MTGSATSVLDPVGGAGGQAHRARCVWALAGEGSAPTGSAHLGGRRSAGGVAARPEHDLIQRIEAERRRLLCSDEMLDDGTLTAGPYDHGVTVVAACQVSKTPRSALLLYLLVREFKPQTIVELGTNVGISSAYLAAGLQHNGQGGRLATLEASQYRLRLAAAIHANAELSNVTYVHGLFADTLNVALDGIGEVDLAFIDGHHQYQPTLDYFETIHQRAEPNAIYVFDDVRWSKGMKRAWNEVRRDDRIGVAADLHSVGIAAGTSAANGPRHMSAPIYGALR